MSFLLPIQGVLAPPLIINYVADVDTYYYTATDNNDIIVSIHLSSQNAAAEIYLALWDGTADLWFYAHTFTAVGQEDALDDMPIRLLTGHKIKAVASVADAIAMALVRVTIPGRNISGGPR